MNGGEERDRSGGAESSGEAQRPRRKRRAELNPELITEAAVRIADADGLDAVSIRRVAEALDARAMSLYDHIESKGDLLSQMGQSAAQGVLVENLPEDWRSALTAIARKMYATFVAHPWIVFVFAQRPKMGSSGVRQARQFVDAMAGLQLEDSEVWSVAGTINDYVLGHSLRIAANPPDRNLDDVIPPREMEEFSELASLPDYMRTRGTIERFEFGLKVVLNGIERSVSGEAEG